jgi:hypothetical protein
MSVLLAHKHRQTGLDHVQYTVDVRVDARLKVSDVNL